MAVVLVDELAHDFAAFNHEILTPDDSSADLGARTARLASLARRYCLDVVQQVNALTPAAREVALIVLEDHLRGCVIDAVQQDNADPAITEIMTVLGKAMGR